MFEKKMSLRQVFFIFRAFPNGIYRLKYSTWRMLQRGVNEIQADIILVDLGPTLALLTVQC